MIEKSWYGSVERMWSTKHCQSKVHGILDTGYKTKVEIFVGMPLNIYNDADAVSSTCKLDILLFELKAFNCWILLNWIKLQH